MAKYLDFISYTIQFYPNWKSGRPIVAFMVLAIRKHDPKAIEHGKKKVLPFWQIELLDSKEKKQKEMSNFTLLIT